MRLVCLLLASLLLPEICLAELTNENLIQDLPTGFKISSQANSGRTLITTMIPQNETEENWTEMLETQVMLGQKDATLAQVQSIMKRVWLSECPGGALEPITNGEENGYPFSLWVQGCRAKFLTREPEKAWIKAIKGNDSFYVVKKSFRFDPSNEQITDLMKYLRSVLVCDTRLADRSCPKLGKVVQ